jgi:hypothetical protein
MPLKTTGIDTQLSNTKLSEIDFYLFAQPFYLTVRRMPHLDHSVLAYSIYGTD